MDSTSNTVSPHESRRLNTKTALRKLPWLDRTHPRNVSGTPAILQTNSVPQTQHDSPTKRPSITRPTSFHHPAPSSPSDFKSNLVSSPTASMFALHEKSRDPSPDLIEISEVRNIKADSPAIIGCTNIPPSQPIPSRSAPERAHNKQLSNAIEGLEEMVQEATEIAEYSGNKDQTEEIYGIIEDARSALIKASGDYSDDLSSSLRVTGSFGDPSDFLNTSLPYSGQRRALDGIDWAYSRRGDSSSSSSSISQSDEPDRRGHAMFGTQSDLLLPPQPIQMKLTQREQPQCCQHRHGSLDLEEKKRRHYNKALHVREQANHHTFSLRRHHRRQPIARNWSTGKKRWTASIACMNTALLGIIVGIYAGEVPRIQYMLADEQHHTIIGNVVFYLGLAISTFICWPLPLLHGRKPYILAALALLLPLQFPQAIVVGSKRSPKNPSYRIGLLCARAASGLVLGFANVNYFTVLLDLFGASLQSKNPHQEVFVADDMRRHGGGMGIWLGIWSWCWIGSLAVGFQIGAAIIENLTPDWGFYIIVILLALALVLNIVAPETRRAPYRKSVTELYDCDENYITRRISCGEVKLHISTEGPIYWFEEVWAGMKLATTMMCQPGFLVLSFYLGWIYAQIVLVIILLGALLSRDYKWYPRYVGLGVMSIAIGALLAIPLTKAGIFSRERRKPFRTDSMTFEKRITWSSHMIRRIIFTLLLPFMGLSYTVSSAGRPKPYMVPIVFAGAVGFLSILAIAECNGLIMETFDTCDLQPGVNTKHRLQSMAPEDRRRRTNYSSFPRVTAGIFVSQTLAFTGAAIATGIGGIMTRHIGAQASTGVTAGILLGLTILLTAVLWRFRKVQVIPNYTFGTKRDTRAWEEFKQLENEGQGSDWKAVVIGNPSGKMRRMSVLELGALSRWTEIRRLNFLIRARKV